MNAEVKATSNKQGLVSFGKIPQGTYYMKETVTPEGYKKLTNIYTVVVDGMTPIANVVHSDDDGSIISDVEGMKLTKGLDNGAIKNASYSVSLEVSFVVEGDYADKTRKFELELTVPEDSQLVGTIGNEPVVLTDGHATFRLTDGQTIHFANVPKADYTLSQTKVAPYKTQAPSDDSKGVKVDTTDGDKFVIALSQISGTNDDSAKVTIKNTLANTDVPATGIGDNTIVWVAIIAGSVFLMALVWRSRRLEH